MSPMSTRVYAALLTLLAGVPAVYLLVAIQYSAITVPFWDHVDLIRFIVPWYEGHFQFSSLWVPHNHTRPFVYRLVMVLNAVATNWDIRSEYIYLYLSIYGTFACYVWLASRIVIGAGAAVVRPVTLLSISLLLFSPVGHNNHWWSMMFQLDATNFFIALSLALVFVRPNSWATHVVAAISCWLAAFTLTNGFFAIAAIIVTLQLSTARLLRLDRFALFWIVNAVVASALYLPGMHMDASPQNPTLLQLIEFTLAYLGTPLSGLLWFPYSNMFHIPLSVVPSAICGFGLLLSCAALSWNALPRLRQRDSAAMVLFGFAGFAMLSAVATGWARAAFDEYGVSNGNASRYSIFGAYLLLGQVYYVGAGLAQGWWDERSYPWLSRRAVFSLAVLFAIASFVSYGRGWKVYADAHQFNNNLTQAYTWGTAPMDGDKFIHPNPQTVAYLKREMQLLDLGPYASRALRQVPFPAGKFSKPAYLSSRRSVTQRFTATEDGLKRLSFKFVTPAGKATKGIVKWQLVEVGDPQPVITGEVDGASARDWAPISLQLPFIANSKGRVYELTFQGSADDAAALCIPLYARVDGSLPPTILSDETDATRGQDAMDLTLEYAR